jgi:hypothetical protein
VVLATVGCGLDRIPREVQRHGPKLLD